MISDRSRLPQSQRVAQELRTLIAEGLWEAGSQIPTTRELSERFTVSLNTIQGALRELEMAGLINRRPRVGTFVAESLDNSGASPATATSQPTQRNQIAVLWGQASDDTEPMLQDGSWRQRIFHRAQQEFTAAGYLVTLSEGIEHWEQHLVGNERDWAGVLSFVDSRTPPVLRRLDEWSVPWVTINPLRERWRHNFVSADNFAGGRLVGRCFARMGYERTLLMGTPLANSNEGSPPKTSMLDKTHGFIQGYLDEGKPLRGMEYACAGIAASEAEGYARMNHHLDNFGPPDGVFAAGGDLMALGAIRALLNRGIPVPAQTGVVGGTGVEFGEYVTPPLTALGQPMEDMGTAVADMLLTMIRRKWTRVIGRYIPCHFLDRSSLDLSSEALSLVQDHQTKAAALLSEADPQIAPV